MKKEGFMQRLQHLLITLFFALLLLCVCVILFATDGNSTGVQAEQAPPDEVVPLGGFTADGAAVNTAATTGTTPALAINAAGDLWTALRQNDQIVVTKFNPTTQRWVQQGSALTNDGSNPALVLDDATNRAWVAWLETTNATEQIMTAQFDGSAWQPTGPLTDNNQNGDKAALTIGATVTNAMPMPWAAWAATSGITVKRAITDANGPGGISWANVGETVALVAGATAAPDLGFAGAGERTPWVAWSEVDSSNKAFIFAARGVADNSAPGGLRWQPVGKVAGCTQSNCNLNADPQRAAQDVKLATGALPGESTTTPWVVFATATAANGQEIRVMRLDDGATATDPSDDRFIPAGGAVNTQCLSAAGITPSNGSQPDLFFVGAVPHVAWIETKEGWGQLFVCHLGDTRPGQERWDLDTIFPLNRTASATAVAPALSGNGNTPYVAWQEGNGQTKVFVAHRYPDGPAWGSNRPPFIRTISWSRNLVGRVGPEAAISRALEAITSSTNPLTLTTSCDHVSGWEHITEIQFKVANDKLTAFSGKYVAAEDKVYVENPNQPGTFVGGVKPGSSTAPIATTIATLYVANMRVRSHGDSSPALDIDWLISFNEPTMFQDLKQMINIVYDDGKTTGFFETGVLSFDYRAYMPVVKTSE